MDDGVKDSKSKSTVSADDDPEKSHEEPSTSTSTARKDPDDRSQEKNRTVKEILDQVLNCTVIHMPNQNENTTSEVNLSKPIENSATKIVTVKEILGEILQYNVCHSFPPSTTSLPHCNCGCDIPPYVPSTSKGSKPRSDLDVTKDAPGYSPFKIYSSSKLQDSTLRAETRLTKASSRVLPTYSTVLRQGPANPQIKSSDSFVPKRPPPSYAEVEGIWDDMPSAVSSDSVMYGPEPLYLICPVCRIIVLTQVERERSAITHWIALILCLFLCWPCCLLPYYMKSCSYSYHTCPNCDHFFGMYNPF